MSRRLAIKSPTPVRLSPTFVTADGTYIERKADGFVVIHTPGERQPSCCLSGQHFRKTGANGIWPMCTDCHCCLNICDIHKKE